MTDWQPSNALEVSNGPPRNDIEILKLEGCFSIKDGLNRQRAPGIPFFTSLGRVVYSILEGLLRVDFLTSTSYCDRFI